MNKLVKIVNFSFLSTLRALPRQSFSSLNSNKGSAFVAAPNPTYLAERIRYFLQIKAKNDKTISEVNKPEITITLKDGRIVKGRAFQTTPLSLTKMMPRQVAQTAVVAKIQYTKKYDSPFSKLLVGVQPEEVVAQTASNKIAYELLDLNRPIQGDCNLELLTFEDKIGKQVFWHSSSHLLGQSLQKKLGVWLCHGPPLQNGFFYDSFMGDHRISQADYESLEKEIKIFAKQKQIFERAILTKNQALQLFSYNPFKTELISTKIPENGLTTVYRCGNLVDLCTGPHIPSTDKVRGFKITKNSSAYWLGQKDKDVLQRVYGISFPKQQQLEEYLKIQQQLAKKDHRFIGQSQQLFSFSTLSPGSAFFHHHGTIIYNRLIELMRSQYRIRGYNEVITPNIFHSQLWKMSGHYFKYKENIFFVSEGQAQEEHGLKPMNCPGHCIMFSHLQRSYKDLPVRMADFGVLHRNELHGALSGLTRVRRFQQDDAHIFCMFDQIQAEILGVLDLLDYIYSVFGFKYTLQLSTRPDKYLGSLEEWNMAEEQLKKALERFNCPYKINQGDGAFYGPKIDVKLTDVFQRQHQCGTVQLDFQLPIRFDLQYRTNQTSKAHQQYHHEQACSSPTLQESISKSSEQEKYEAGRPLKQGFARPVIIHRAIFGSLERFIAILCEHTGGKWDFWLSPRQIKLITLGSDSIEYAQQVYNTLLLKGYAVELDVKNQSLSKKVRNAQLQGFNYIGVIGNEQAKDRSINMRKRDEAKQMGRMKLEEVLRLFQSQQPPKSKLRQKLESQSIQ